MTDIQTHKKYIKKKQTNIIIRLCVKKRRNDLSSLLIYIYIYILVIIIHPICSLLDNRLISPVSILVERRIKQMTNRQTKQKKKKKKKKKKRKMHSFGCHVKRLSRLRIHCTISTENKSTMIFDKLREYI